MQALFVIQAEMGEGGGGEGGRGEAEQQLDMLGREARLARGLRDDNFRLEEALARWVVQVANFVNFES